MKNCCGAQAQLAAEGCSCRISGCIRLLPMRCGSVVQVHVCGLPRCRAFYGLYIELCGQRCALPPLISCSSEALMSVYTDAFTPAEAVGCPAVLTTDPCIPGGCTRIACGRIMPDRADCRPDPRPLFAAPIHW